MLIHSLQLKALSTHCQTMSLVITVCSLTANTFTPVFMIDAKLKTFLEMLFNLQFNDFVQKMEAFSISGMREVQNGKDERLQHKCYVQEKCRSELHELQLLALLAFC